MSVNVIERILVRALQSAGLTRASAIKGRNPILDRWENGYGFEARKSFQRHEPKAEIDKIDKPKRRTVGTVMSLTRLRQLMIDSGASLHLIGMDDLTNEEKRSRYRLTQPIPLQTANNVAWAEEATMVHIHELQ